MQYDREPGSISLEDVKVATTVGNQPTSITTAAPKLVTTTPLPASVTPPELGISKRFDADGEVQLPTLGRVTTVLPKGQITVTLDYVNIGGAPAQDTEIVDFIPSGARLVANSVRVDERKVKVRALGNILILNVSDLAPRGPSAPDSAGTISYRVELSAPVGGTGAVGSFINGKGGYIKTASFRRGLVHMRPEEINALVVAPITFDLAPTGTKQPVRDGDIITHNVYFRNNGGVSASEVRIEIPVPAGTEFVAGSMAFLDAPEAPHSDPAQSATPPADNRTGVLVFTSVSPVRGDRP